MTRAQNLVCNYPDLFKKMKTALEKFEDQTAKPGDLRGKLRELGVKGDDLDCFECLLDGSWWWYKDSEHCDTAMFNRYFKYDQDDRIIVLKENAP